MKRVPVSNALTLVFACAGAYVGYLAFSYLAQRGFYALILPGGLAGLAGGISRSRSIVVPILCGFLATIAGLLTEHWFAPFLADGSLGYFLSHIADLRPLTLVLIAVGGAIGFWVPFRRRVHAGAS